MLQGGPHTVARNICARCAFRSQIAVLRQKRLKHHSTKYNDTDVNATDQAISGSLSRPRQRTYHNFGAEESKPTSIRKVVGAGRFRLAQRGLQRGRPQDFSEALRSCLQSVKLAVKSAPLLERYTVNATKEDDDKRDAPGFRKLWAEFVQSIHRSTQEAGKASRDTRGRKNSAPLIIDLSKEYKAGGPRALENRITYRFFEQVIGSQFSTRDVQHQEAIADLRYPSEWFPATRVVQRTIHLHVGPTNSGKTYQALQRLEQAQKGTYAGPLRLLAHEVYTRMNAKGKTCTLVTGEERRFPEGSTETGDICSCTVEMIPLNTILDVAVIDEIQMIGNHERGWAWTQALLGVKAKEVHLCGEERTVPLIQALCASTGEKLEIHRYQRLSPLQVDDMPLNGDLKLLRKGDCIVSFSVLGIHALRRRIEKATGQKVAIVYGSLPPETRAQQARLFNDPDNDYDFLVASDAVGMGLNLAIKRIIFESTSKFDGSKRQTLSVADIKQIAGRAGRYRTAAQVNEKPVSAQDVAAAKGDAPAQPAHIPAENVGLVTTLEVFDFPIVKSAMATEPEPIVSAGVQPPAAVLERFASYFPPDTPFSYILTRLHELSQMHLRFHLCSIGDNVWLADLIEPVKGVTIADRNVLCAAPAGRTDVSLWTELMPAFARCVAEQTSVTIADIKELPLEVLEAEASPSREYLRDLEQLHKGVVGYLWLSYRFAGIFTARPLAFHVKSLVEEKIEHALANLSFSEAHHRRLVALREKQLLQDLSLGEDGKIILDAQEDGDVQTVNIPQEGIESGGLAGDAPVREPAASQV